MGKYSETDLTWSSVEKNYQYEKVRWGMQKNGIPRFELFDEKGEKIEINV
jgi:hypothetical protein